MKKSGFLLNQKPAVQESLSFLNNSSSIRDPF